MHQRSHLIFYSLRFVLAGVYVVVCLFLLSLLVSAIAGGTKANNAEAAAASPVMGTDSPNAVSSGLSRMLDGAGTAADSVQNALAGSTRGIASAIAGSGKAIGDGIGHAAGGTVHGVASAARWTGHAFAVTGRAIGQGVAFVFFMPVNIVEAASHTPPVSAAIRPPDHEPVPVINPNSPELAKAVAAMNVPSTSTTTKAAAPPQQPLAIWPIRGEITTQFGVPEPPYQPIHTGIDISDGKPAGVTPIKAFRQGRVIDVEHTGGLGNHVVVDHGSGVTSVYGHMNSIAVSVGQEVDTTTTLGYEGTTGVSTGPHLHFEIRINGQAVDPHRFISGQPY